MINEPKIKHIWIIGFTNMRHEIAVSNALEINN